MSNFQESKSIGKKGEDVVLAYLRSRAGIYNLEDISENPQLREWGVDLAWKDSLEKHVLAEIKTDTWMYRTGNFFLEITSNTKKDTPGWVFSSIAARLLYLSWGDAVLYDLNMSDTLDFVGYHGKKYRKIRAETKSKFDDKILYQAEGILVPKTHLLGWVNDHQIIDVREFYSK